MRALNASKMDRMFAKPFIASLEGHIDAVEVLCRKPGTVNIVASGSWDGGESLTHSISRRPTAVGVIVHNISEQKHSHQIQGAHEGKISGLCFADGDRLLSCGVDCNIKLWDVSLQEQTSVSILALFVLFPSRLTVNPATKTAQRVRRKITLQVWTSVDQGGCPTHVIPYSSIDHHRTDALFATASNIVQIWDEDKSISFAMLHWPAIDHFPPGAPLSPTSLSQQPLRLSPRCVSTSLKRLCSEA